MDRRTQPQISVALLSAAMAIVLRRWMFPNHTWWPVLMIMLLLTALGLFLWRRRAGEK